MRKKYIIELEDNESVYKTIIANGYPILQVIVPIPYTEPDMEKIREEAYEKGKMDAYVEDSKNITVLKEEAEEAYEDGYKTAKVQCNIQAEKDLREVGERHYQKGLSDAWDVARTLWNTPNRKEIFGYTVFSNALMSLTGQEVIEKIRQYEQKKEEQIAKGDIVLIKSTPEVEILVTYADEEYVSGIALTEVDGSCEIGDQYTNIRISNVEKTGKHYDIVSVLQKMRES